MKVLFFDTETTGIKTRDNPSFKPRLVQLGAILQDTDTCRVLGELNLISKCNDVDIPVEATNIHGITNELAAYAGIWEHEIDPVFAALVKQADLIVAHNIAYDVDVVHDNLPLTEVWIKSKPVFCTMVGSLYVVRTPASPQDKLYYVRDGRLWNDSPYKYPSLASTHKHFFGRPHDGAHDAMADVRACRDVFFKLLDEGFYDLHQANLGPTKRLMSSWKASKA
ncbi:3'-5' exonuclease [Streptomyces europaeiscabiei]|uniref:3'-5' exonuclease n=1 Tax=Streptomyces europaeiscabiei TaxID=146819 RepID=UPI00099B2E4C|nr:3'-5' exonuclease [Streptomyces europaeiscabiei]